MSARGVGSDDIQLPESPFALKSVKQRPVIDA